MGRENEMIYQQSFSFQTLPKAMGTQWGHPQFFTSFRLVRGKIIFLSQHIERLKRSLIHQVSNLGLEWSQIENSIRQVLLDLTTRYKADELRGRILVDLHVPNFTIFLGQAPRCGGAIEVGVHEWKSNVFPSWIKRWPYDERMLALNESEHDEVILHRNQRVLSGLTSSLFLFDGNEVRTPPLSDGVLDGIARKQLIKFLVNLGYAVSETFIDLGEINKSCGLVMTNSVRGARQVARFVKDNSIIEIQHFPHFSEHIESWNRRNFE